MNVVTVQYWEEERLATRYITEVEVPVDFQSWDKDRQGKYLDEVKSEFSPRSASTIDGETIESHIEGWSQGAAKVGLDGSVEPIWP